MVSGEALLFTIAIAFVLLAMAKERAELHQRRAALIDSLTGLANRRAFLQDAEDLIRLQVRRGRPVAVFLIDLDHFKSINDRFGHMVGDKVLKLFGDLAKAKLRGTDIVGRLGGEEFAVLLADADRDNAFLVAERLRSAFATSSIVAADAVVSATISIGIAIIQDPNEDLTHLLASADQALYRAKANGRNQCVLAAIDQPADGLMEAASPSVVPVRSHSPAAVRAA